MVATSVQTVPPTPYQQALLLTVASTQVFSACQIQQLETLLGALSGVPAEDGPRVWQHVAQHMLLPSHPFELHVQLARVVYSGWPATALGPPPLWLPHPVDAAATNIARFMTTYEGGPLWRAGRNGCPARNWQLLQRLSWQDPEAFWPAALKALGISFSTPPTRAVLLDANPDKCRWLPGARLNIARCALEARRAPAGCPALVWAREGSPRALSTVSRAELRARVSRLAACVALRFNPGDAVALYLPMSCDAVALYLALVLAGCCVVGVADSFAAAELRTRLAIAGAKGVFTQDVALRAGKALPLYQKVVEAGCSGVVAVVLPAAGEGRPLHTSAPPLRPGDLTMDQFCSLAPPPPQQQQQVEAPLPAYEADAYATTNILFSSGTTGEPKAIPWSHLTPLRCALDGWAQLDIRPGDRVAWPTSMGWMMGPWLLYAALLNGATLALYEGAPLGRDFGEFLEASCCAVVGLVPSIVRAWRGSGALEGLDLSCVRCWGSTGEASAPEDYHWLMARVAGYRPVIEYCGGTELGGAYLSSTPLHACSPSTFTTPTLGTRLLLLDPDTLQQQQGGGGAGGVPADGSAAAAVAVVDGEGPFEPGAGAAAAAAACGGGGVACSGEVALAMPMLGASQRLLNKDHFKVYYAGMPLHGASGRPLRRHGDELAVLAGGRVQALGRCDDTMNLGGIKVSSVEIERAVQEGVPAVLEAAAVGMPTPGGGPEHLWLFVVLGRQQQQQQEQGQGGGAAALSQQCQEAVRSRLNPLFKVQRVVVRSSLPRNASNKLMRRVLRDEAPAARSRL